jgi:hypothetical protein
VADVKLSSLRFLLGLLAAVSGTATAWAGWAELKVGADERAVLAMLGQPIIVSRGIHGLHVTWTYDLGGYVQFERGRVVFWQRSRPTPAH